MKRVIAVLILGAALSLCAEPLEDLLSKWAHDYVLVTNDVAKIESLVKSRYPETWFITDDDEVVDSVAGSGIDDQWVEFDYVEMNRLKDQVGAMASASVPVINPCFKTSEVKGSFLNSAAFSSARTGFEDFLVTLTEIALVLMPDTSFAAVCPTIDEDNRELESWKVWYEATLGIEAWKVGRALEDFEIRYGSASARVNFLELALTNWVPPFKGSINGPSAWEPILRFTPVCYDISDSRFAKTYQVGTNYYFLSGSPDFLRWLDHVGVAFAAADLASDQLYRFSFGELSYGAMLHIGRYQMGMFKDHGGEGWKLLSTFDFQVIPALF